jgi:hypothetical protein
VKMFHALVFVIGLFRFSQMLGWGWPWLTEASHTSSFDQLAASFSTTSVIVDICLRKKSPNRDSVPACPCLIERLPLRVIDPCLCVCILVIISDLFKSFRSQGAFLAYLCSHNYVKLLNAFLSNKSIHIYEIFKPPMFSNLFFLFWLG